MCYRRISSVGVGPLVLIEVNTPPGHSYYVFFCVSINGSAESRASAEGWIAVDQISGNVYVTY
jgi:hypothetical protein